MKITPRIAFAALLLAVSPIAAFAAEERDEASCAVGAATDHGTAALLSRDEIRTKLAEAGFTDLRSLDEEDGCLEAKGIDKSGKRFEVYVDPATGAVIAPR